MGGWTSQVMAGVQSMSRPKNSKLSAISSLFSRRDKSYPEVDITSDIAGTLEEISRQVKKEATETRLFDDDFFSPTHVLKHKTRAEETKVEATTSRKDRIVRHRRLTPDQYENIIENSLSVLDMASQIIDRNRAITSKLKNIPV
jgi:hypothetical protein